MPGLGVGPTCCRQEMRCRCRQGTDTDGAHEQPGETSADSGGGKMGDDTRDPLADSLHNHGP